MLFLKFHLYDHNIDMEIYNETCYDLLDPKHEGTTLEDLPYVFYKLLIFPAFSEILLEKCKYVSQQKET